MNFLDLAIKSILAGTVGWAAVSLLRRSSASARHVTMFLTLIGVSLLPIISLMVPRWYVPFLKLSEATPATATRLVTSGSSIQTPSIVHSALPMQVSAMEVLLSVWIVVAAFLCLRMLAKLLILSRAERSLAMAIDPGLQALVAERCREMGRHVLLLEGLDNEPPMTWGHYRPVLVLPGEARSWPEDRLNSVVLHEIAHIERGDWLASMFAQLACAVYWFNPFVWALRKQMEIESETAADDRVLAMGISATQYASHLVAVSKDLCIGRNSTQVALAMARPGKLDRRIRAILESQRSRRTLRGSVTLGLAAVIVSIVGLLAAAAPTVVKSAHITPPDVSISSVGTSDNIEPMIDGSSETRDTDTDTETATFAKSSGDDQPSQSKGNIVNVRKPEVKAKPAPKPTSNRKEKSGDSAQKGHAPKTSVASGSDPDSISVDFDLKEFGEEMKKAGVQMDAATKEAMKSMGNSSVGSKAFVEGIRAITQASTKLAIQSASKVATASIADAMKQIKNAHLDHLPPSSKRPH